MSVSGSITLCGKGKVFSRLNDFRKGEVLCDVKLAIDGKVFPAHKNVLAGFSPFFEGMFLGNFVEAHQDLITLTSIDADIAECLLDYAYTDAITITNSNVLSLLHATSFLQLEDLFECACEFLEDNLSASNCLDAYSHGEVFSRVQLINKAKSFILANFLDVSHSVSFFELEADKVIEIIDDDLLKVDKEEHVFDAVLRWFYYNEDGRRADLGKVLSHVKFAFLSPTFLHSRASILKLLQDTKSFRKLMEKVMWYHLLPYQRNEVHYPFTRRRRCSPVIEVLFLYGKCLKINNFRTFCVPVSEEPLRIIELPTFPAMYWWSACNYRMHALSENDKQTIKYFQSKNSKWKTAFKLKRRFHGRSLIVNVDGYWYSFGDSSIGKNNGPDKYDSRTEVWEKIAPLPEPIENADVISLQGMIYVVGGKKKCANSSSRILRYDPTVNTWTVITTFPAPAARLKPRVCGLNGRIYIFSGFSVALEEEAENVRRVDFYDLSSNLWKRCRDIPHKLHRSYMTSPVVLDGRIHVLTKPSVDRSEIQVYYPLSDTWQDFRKIDSFEINCVQGPLLIQRP